MKIFFQQWPEFHPLVRLIHKVQGSPWTHCGIVVDGGKSVIEALPFFGVVKVPMWFAKARFFWKKSVVRYVPVKGDEYEDSEKLAYKQLGKAYDLQYDTSSPSYSCAELVYDVYAIATGKPLTHLKSVGKWFSNGLEGEIAKYQKDNIYYAGQLLVTTLDIYENTFPIPK